MSLQRNLSLVADKGQVVNHWDENNILKPPSKQTIKKEDKIMVSVGGHWMVGMWWAFLCHCLKSNKTL